MRRLALAAAVAICLSGLLPATTAAATHPTCFGVSARTIGTNGPDVLIGTPHRDVIVGRGGDDGIRGLGGGDLLCGGAGNDEILGGSGRDFMLT